MMKNYSTKVLIYSFLFALFGLSSLNTKGQCTLIGDSAVCDGESITYTTTSSGSVYQWNAYPGTVSGSGTSVSVAWNGSGTGLLTLVVKDAFGSVICSGTKSIDIYDQPEPIISPSFIAGCSNDTTRKGQERKDEGCMSVCDSTWVTYTVIDHPGSTYSWSISGSGITVPSVTNSFSVYWTGAGGGQVEVTETNMYGCEGTAKLCVEIVEKPIADFSTLPAAVSGTVSACLGQDIIFLNNSSDGGGSDIWSYTWVWGDGTEDIIEADGYDNSTTHAYATSGIKNIMLIVENECHCKDTTYLTANISSTPPPNIECISTVCPGNAETYTTDASCTGYLWSAINGTIVGDSTTATVTVTWDGTGPGYLGLTTTGCTPATCPYEVFIEVPVIPSVAAIMGSGVVCQYDCGTYKLNCSIPVDSIVWHFPSGVTVSSDTINVHEVDVCFYSPGFDTGTLFVEYFHSSPGETSNLDCGGTASLLLRQRPKMNLNGPTFICDGANLTLSYGLYSSADPLFINITDGDTKDTTFETTTTGTSFTLPWTFWGGGFYTATVWDTAGYYCDGPLSKSFEVIEVPDPVDLVGPDTICPEGAYDYFGVGTSSDYAITWHVSNTGGTTALGSGSTMPIVWPTTPSYPHNLCIVQIDPISGCKSDPLCDSIYSASPLPPPVISGPDTVCSNGDQNYSATSLGDGYQWSISPAIAGSVISGQGEGNTTIQWNDWTGNATIKVIAEGCGSDTASSTYVVAVIGTPPPLLTLPAAICEGTPVTMSSATTSATFSWDFGDGTTGSGSPVNHTYNSDGNMLVTLTATYTGYCTGSASTTGTIMVYPQPNITISTPDPNVFCGTVLTVNMFVASPVGGTSYGWYSSPSGSFITSGTTYSSNTIGGYYVKGTNVYGCTDSSNIIMIDTNCQKPCIGKGKVDFNFKRIGCNTDTFAGIVSLGGINPRYNFDDPFGSPNTASGLNAIHTFPEPGYYRVKFCADFPNSSGTGYCEVCVTKVDTVKYIADFFDSMYCKDGVDSLTFKLVNNTKILTGMPTPSYAWDINASGTISTSPSPSFTLAPGTYVITLTVDGTCTKVKTVTVDSFPVASFTSGDSICVEAPLYITNTSTNVDTSNIYWTYGDGASSEIYSPTKVYTTAGTYDLQLSVSNAYGCKDIVMKHITVLPNTLVASFTYPSPTLCSGDSVLLSDASSGGHPGYDWLWSTVQSTPNIYAKYTGNYYFDLEDSKGCKAKSNEQVFLFNPSPTPQISGPEIICIGQTTPQYTVNYPNAGNSFEWKIDGTVVTWATSNQLYASNPPGTYLITLTVTSDSGCIGYDTFAYEVRNLPNVAVSAAATLCEGEEHLLVGSSTNTDLAGSYWSNGETNDSIFTEIPGMYTYTVVDTFGCSNSAARTIHPLPDFCGLMTGCYEFCDTVEWVVWDAPKGYASYQWLFNGSPIAWATSDTFNVPLYQSGNYQLVLTSVYGCTDTSESIDIEFIDCSEGCQVEVKYEVDCGPVDENGYQTYTVTLQVNNTYGAGSILNLDATAGTFSGTSPTVLPLGWNTVTTTFTDVAPTDDTVCVDLYLTYNNERCKTEFCFELPDCSGECQLNVAHQNIDCAGYDDAGNPMYLLCFDVSYSGSNGSTLTMTTSSGSFTPNPVTINNGLNSLCFTYTDLPPHSTVASFELNVFDPITMKVCKTKFKMQYKPCPDSCTFDIFGICAHCKEETDEGWVYNIEMSINNTLGPGATPSILPISEGVFGAISPASLPLGMSTVNVQFTDSPDRDSIICFRVLLEYGDHKCWQDVCVYLPDCDHLGIGDLTTYFSIAPNPANNKVIVSHSSSGTSTNVLKIYNAVGQKVKEAELDNLNPETEVEISDLESGVYFIQMYSNGLFRGNLKLVVQH